MKHVSILLMVAILAACCGGCVEETPQQITQRQTESQKAQVAANSITFTENAEIQNITNRLKLTSDPGLTGFALLLNEAGQPIYYTGVRGKITSGGKRLGQAYIVKHWDCGEWGCDKELPAPSDEGTWGSSGEYVFFWTTTGQYIQWNGKYLYSDKPFRLTVEPLVVNITK